MALGTLGASPAFAAAWTINTSATLQEAYSDNISLTPPGTERSDWVTTVTPRVAVRGVGDRLMLDGEYAPQFLYWSREGSSHLLHLYNVGGTFQFIKQLAGVDFRSAETQQIVSPFGPQSVDNVNLSGNRTAVRTNVVSPFFHYEFQNDAIVDARYTFSTVNSGASDVLSNSRSSRIDLNARSGPSNRVLTWSIKYNKEHIDYKDPATPNFDYQTVVAGLRRLVSTQFALIANAGYEKADYLAIGTPPQGSLWNAGFQWEPSPRTHLEATAGHRFYGRTGSFDFSHRTALTVWNVRYSEDITTTRSNFLIPSTPDTAAFLGTLFTSAYPDPAARQAAVNAFLARNGLASSFDTPVNYFTNVPFLDKRLQASFGIQGVRNTVLANVYRDRREPVTATESLVPNLTALDRTRQTGGSLAWTHLLSSRTSANVVLGLERVAFSEIERDDKRRYARAMLTHQFNPRLWGSLSYRRLQNSSTDLSSEYRENAVVALVTATF